MSPPPVRAPPLLSVWGKYVTSAARSPTPLGPRVEETLWEPAFDLVTAQAALDAHPESAWPGVQDIRRQR